MCGGGKNFRNTPRHFPQRLEEDGFLRDAEVKPQDED